MFTKNKIKEIFSKTKGHCHFCGDPLILEKVWMERFRRFRWCLGNGSYNSKR